MASSLEREGQVGRSSAAGAANHRRVWGAAGYTTRSSPAPTWPAARTAGLEVPRRTGRGHGQRPRRGKQGAGRGVFGNEAPPIWGGRPSPNSSSAGKCPRFQNSPGLLSVLFWGSPGLPSRAVPSEAVERGRQQRGGAARGSGAQAAGLQAAGKGHTCPRPLQPSGRERRRGPAPGTRGLKGRHGERGFGAMAEAGCRKGSAELPWELGAPAPGGSLSREDRTRPQLRLAAPAPLLWGRGWTVSLAAHDLRGTEPRGRKDLGGPHQPRKHGATSVTTTSRGSASRAPQEPQFENPLSVGGWHLGSQRHPLPGG